MFLISVIVPLHSGQVAGIGLHMEMSDITQAPGISYKLDALVPAVCSLADCTV
jgi:hypothetical protein